MAEMEAAGIRYWLTGKRHGKPGGAGESTTTRCCSSRRRCAQSSSQRIYHQESDLAVSAAGVLLSLRGAQRSSRERRAILLCPDRLSLVP